MLAKTPLSERRADALRVLRTTKLYHRNFATMSPAHGYCALQILAQHFGYSHDMWTACAREVLELPISTVDMLTTYNDEGKPLRAIANRLEHSMHFLEERGL